MDEIPAKTFYITEDTRITHYLPYPTYLLDMSISQTAKTLYALLLNRATLSQKNNWCDEYGRVYIRFTIEAMSDALNKSQTTIKKALSELENAELIERRKDRFGKPNLLYVKLMDLSVGNISCYGSETCPSIGQETDCDTVGFLTPNNCISNKNIENRIDDIIRAAYGRYQNVYLSDEEYTALQADYGIDTDRFIEELSNYLAATGRTYENYEAAIRLWASKDRKTPGHKTENQDYSCEEGESY
ncbi:MAG: replication initiator protein A [Bacillota bacterium]|nr:replication initiator protein A [Bacillota bacterium]